jgi:hypothetical protein
MAGAEAPTRAAVIATLHSSSTSSNSMRPLIFVNAFLGFALFGHPVTYNTAGRLRRSQPKWRRVPAISAFRVFPSVWNRVSPVEAAARPAWDGREGAR